MDIFVQTLKLNKTYRINVSIMKIEICQKSRRTYVAIIFNQLLIVITIVIWQVLKNKGSKFQKVINIQILNLNQTY